MTQALLDDIHLFVQIARTGSFKRAAQSLQMPPATLSRRLAALETRIGLKLLNRTTRNVNLTVAGQSYFEQCSPLVDAMLGAHEEISQSAATATGTLRLTCTPDFAATYLPSVIKHYSEECPKVQIEVSLNSSIEDLFTHNFDMGIRIGPLPPSLLVAHPLGHLQHLLCAAPGYLRSAAPINTPEDLAQHACIRMNSLSSTGVWKLDHPVHGRREVTVHGRIIAGGPYVSHALALEGLGVSLVDGRIAGEHLSSGRLVRLLPGWESVPVPVNAMTASRLCPPRVRIFIEHLRRSLSP